jgi:hypothetical protein
MNQIINTDRELILKFLNREYKDEHPSLYLYSCGQDRSQQTAVFNILKYTRFIFYPCFSDDYLIEIITEYLKHKKEQYKNGEIQVKPLY